MEVNACCGKKLFIFEVSGVLHTPLLLDKMTSSRFLLLCCDVESCTLEYTLDFHIHFETVTEIIGFNALNLASFYSNFVCNNSRSNSEVFSSTKQFNQCSPTM